MSGPDASVDGISLGDTHETVLKQGRQTSSSKRPDNVEVIHFVTGTQPNLIESTVWLEAGHVVQIEGRRGRVGAHLVTAGLSEDECRALLGEPTSVDSVPEGADCLPAAKRLEYSYGASRLTLHLTPEQDNNENQWNLRLLTLQRADLNW